MRKLASIKKIEEVKLIEGADKICAYRVGGWWVVDSVTKYKVGDLAVYYEIDSFLPIRPQFEFLRKSSYKRMGSSEGFRLKTIRLRNTVSQGLLTPIPEGIIDPKEGDDLTEALDIVKYEPPIPAQLAGKIKGTFPSFIPKTDEERCVSEDTIIITEDGEYTIKYICENKYSGKILSYNPITNSNEWNEILNHSIMNNNNDWYEIELDDGSKMKATGNHKVWLPNLLCYRELRELTTEDFLLKTD
jgi:RNA ligase (TIGR02306 family)